MHGAADGKNRVVGGVPEAWESLAGYTAEKFEGKYRVKDEGFDEGVGGYREGSFVAGTGTIF